MNRYLLIQSINMLISTDDILRAEYFPDHLVDDDIEEYSGRPIPAYTKPARLVIYTREIEISQTYNHQGDPTETGTATKKLVLIGDEADIFWGMLTYLARVGNQEGQK